MTPEQSESFNKNPRFLGLKFPSDVTKLESLEKKYTGKLSKNALSLMTGLLRMDPADRFSGEQALAHPYFDDIRDPADLLPQAPQQENEIDLSTFMAPAQRPIYSSQSRITSYGQKQNTAPGANPSGLQT